MEEAMSHKPGVDPPGGCYPEAAPTAIETVGRPPRESKGEGASQEAAVAKLCISFWGANQLPLNT